MVVNWAAVRPVTSPGETPVPISVGAAKVNWSDGALTTEVLPGVVTVTSTVDVPSAGEVTVMEVGELTVMVVTVTEPNMTAVAPVRFVPVIVTEVPPKIDPEPGLMPVTVATRMQPDTSVRAVATRPVTTNR